MKLTKQCLQHIKKAIQGKLTSGEFTGEINQLAETAHLAWSEYNLKNSQTNKDVIRLSNMPYEKLADYRKEDFVNLVIRLSDTIMGPGERDLSRAKVVKGEIIGSGPYTPTNENTSIVPFVPKPTPTPTPTPSSESSTPTVPILDKAQKKALEREKEDAIRAHIPKVNDLRTHVKNFRSANDEESAREIETQIETLIKEHKENLSKIEEKHYSSAKPTTETPTSGTTGEDKDKVEEKEPTKTTSTKSKPTSKSIAYRFDPKKFKIPGVKLPEKVFSHDSDISYQGHEHHEPALDVYPRSFENIKVEEDRHGNIHVISPNGNHVSPKELSAAVEQHLHLKKLKQNPYLSPLNTVTNDTKRMLNKHLDTLNQEYGTGLKHDNSSHAELANKLYEVSQKIAKRGGSGIQKRINQAHSRIIHEDFIDGLLDSKYSKNKPIQIPTRVKDPKTGEVSTVNKPVSREALKKALLEGKLRGGLTATGKQKLEEAKGSLSSTTADDYLKARSTVDRLKASGTNNTASMRDLRKAVARAVIKADPAQNNSFEEGANRIPRDLGMPQAYGLLKKLAKAGYSKIPPTPERAKKALEYLKANYSPKWKR